MCGKGVFMDIDQLRIVVGKNVKRARLKVGFKSQREMAKYLSFSHKTLSLIENGTITASPAFLKEIAAVCNVPLEALLAESKEIRELIIDIDRAVTSGGDLEVAYRKAIALIRLIPTKTIQRANAFNLMGKVLYKLAKYRRALTCWNVMWDMIQSDSDTTMKFKALFNLANCWFHLNGYVQCLDYCTKALLYTGGDESFKVLVMHRQATVFATLKDYQRALAMHKRTRAYYREHHMKKNELQTVHSIGDILAKTGDLNAAIYHLEDAMTMAKEIKNEAEICNTSSFLAEMLISTNDRTNVEKAKLVLCEAFALTKETRPPKFTACLSYWLSKCSDSVSEKKRLFEQAYFILRKLYEVALFNMVCFDIDELLEKQDDITSAARYYKDAAVASKKIISWRGIG